MAPWTSRGHSARTRNDSVAAEAPTDTAFLSPERVQGPLRVTEAEILQHAYGIPSLHDPTSQASHHASSHGRSPSRHGRSTSNPFPSIFQSKKKRQVDNTTAPLDSADEDPSRPPPGSPIKTATNKFVRVSDKDLTTGKCMTCDSMVRWPKELAVFRCTVCLTINDLKPTGLDPTLGGLDRADFSSSEILFTRTTKLPKALPLSTEKTSALVDQCVVSYLLDRLEHGGDNLEGRAMSPPLQTPSMGKLEGITGRRNELRALETGKQQFPVITQTQPIHIPRRQTCELDIKSSRAHGNSNTISRAYSTSTPGTYDGFSNHAERRLVTHRRSKAHTEGLSVPLGSKEKASTMNIADSTHRKGPDRMIKNIFRPLEDYIIASFRSRECVNSSFTTVGPGTFPRTAGDGTRRKMAVTGDERQHRADVQMSTMDAKTLLIGDFAENGSWWSGSREQRRASNHPRLYRAVTSTEALSSGSGIVNPKSPQIDWAELNNWYRIILCAGINWESHLGDLLGVDRGMSMCQHLPTEEMYEIEEQISDARAHIRRVLLKATESLLKRPGAPLREPDDVRFLLIILENPLLHPSKIQEILMECRSISKPRPRNNGSSKIITSTVSSQTNSSGPGQHSGIIKRVLGLLSNLPNECHHYLVGWFARLSESHFRKTTDLVGGFVTYRLIRQQSKKQPVSHDHTAELIPNVGASGCETSAALHAVLGLSGQSVKKLDDRSISVAYCDDWQTKAAARVMALFFAANISSANWTPHDRPRRHGQIISTSDFYNTLLDYSDLIADFEAWEARRGKFTFCQYPFFLSIWAKIQIMEHDTRRQMEVKAREAFFDSIMTRKAVNQYLILRVRRECLVEDSLKGVSEVVGTGGGEIKKGLRIEFKGEEGIDAGGLRKEWFLLLVRDVFNPEHGMFTYDEDSGLCYFNANSFETSDQFFLVGVVLGLAIYNSTILDIAFPHFAFRKLLAAGPSVTPGSPSHAKPAMTYTLDDLAEFRPALARGLQQLLEFEGDVESTFCRDFVADIERYGQIVQIPLCPGGEKKTVSNANRGEFVDLYVRYLLDISVSKQFEPFKRGFFTVCGGNALSLFRPEEIELLIRGSDEPLDIASLRAVAIYENWGVPNPAETELVIIWFWQSFENAKPEDQRKLLSFITGSDRIPAMGAANLIIKLSCLGENSPRFPVARTCFNMLSLWRYNSHQKLECMLWRAVGDSEGFGLK